MLPSSQKDFVNIITEERVGKLPKEEIKLQILSYSCPALSNNSNFE